MLDEIREILAQYTGVEPGQITPEADLKADLELNSLDLAELVMVFEERAEICIPDRVLFRLRTVGDIETVLREERRIGTK